MNKFLLLFLVLTNVAFAQSDQSKNLFTQFNETPGGRIRQITIEKVFSGPEKQIVVLSRDGQFPNWMGNLTIWKYSKVSKQVEKKMSWTLPKETILYGFLPIPNEHSYLLLVMPNQVQIGKWVENKWIFDSTRNIPIRSFAEVPYGSLAQPFNPVVGIKDEPNLFWVPTLDGYQTFSLDKGKISAKYLIPLKPKSFYYSSHDILPFEFQFWFQNVYWFPKVDVGYVASETGPTFFSPWMDELSMIHTSGNKLVEKTHFFNLLTENERDDGNQYIVNRPIDLNGDGQTDFLVNKFMGTGTAFRAENYYYITDANGEIPAKGQLIKTNKKDASGALVVDLDKDGKQDFVIVSASFTPWSMIRALMKRQVLLSFNFHKYKTDAHPYDFEHADLHQDILFDFHLGDLFIDGIIPSLDGDFNGDGYPDVFYARNRKTLSFLIQHPTEKEFFPSDPTATYSMEVPKKYRIGDIDGDGKDDLVFFNTREEKNKSFKVLMNNGILN